MVIDRKIKHRAAVWRLLAQASQALDAAIARAEALEDTAENMPATIELLAAYKKARVIWMVEVVAAYAGD